MMKATRPDDLEGLALQSLHQMFVLAFSEHFAVVLANRFKGSPSVYYIFIKVSVGAFVVLSRRRK
jgi:hypothetical protein